jgi:hypothetical protein
MTQSLEKRRIVDIILDAKEQGADDGISDPVYRGGED